MPELPSGIVTFLFTDIEGSTRLLRRLRQRYADTLADHHRLLRSACAEAGGHEIGTQGDSLFVVFRKASEAVLGAVAAQRALAGHSWPDEADLRVRMGLHTGEATVSAEGYLGLAVHRVARICAAGHGGQILLSQATQALLEDEEGELGDVLLDDLGLQRLKDFDRPVRIFQVVVSDLPGAFPPLRTEEPPPLAGREPVEAARASTGPRAGSSAIRILIVDDQALVRAGFRMILDAEEGLEVVGEAADGREAVAEALRLKPDVVLMDVRMPEVDGIEATRRLLGGDRSEERRVGKECRL